MTAEQAMNAKLRDVWCAKCKYSETCYGIRNYLTRVECTDRKTDGERAYVKEAPRWSEMSYYHVQNV